MEHGGQLNAASRRHGIAVCDWLDVSTGIAPWTWPVPSLPESVWARLPEDDDDLLAAASSSYGCAPQCLVAVPGSQFAIRELPLMLAPASVLVPRTGYAEHARCWRQAGHRLQWYDNLEELMRLAPQAEHAVVINPNNPTGRCCSIDWQLALRRELRSGGLLVIDEAFMDLRGRGIMPQLPLPGIIALRSLGKFFGLAGLRLGFAAGDEQALAALRRKGQPWGVSHPARWVGSRALRDEHWQRAQRRRIIAANARLAALLQQHFPAAEILSAGLFVSIWFAEPCRAPAVHHALAKQGVLTRLGDDHRWLRVGLPGDQEARLARALESLEVA